MTWDQAYVLALAAGAIVLLALEKAHLSVLGVGLVVAVAAAGLVAPEDAIAGFGNPAVVTIASLFIVGEGFLRTGAAAMLADKILHGAGKSESTIVFVVMAMAAALSAFVNNTLVVVTFMPVITTICRDGGFFPSRLLIPLSYASILGGMCTMVGTSTNLLVRGSLQDLIEDHPSTEPPLPEFEMFTLTPAGLVLAGVGILYLGLVGRRLLPRHHSLSTQMSEGAIKEYVMEIRVSDNSPLIGKPADEVVPRNAAGNKTGPKTMMVIRDEALLSPPFKELEVRAGDILMVSGSIQDLTELQRSEARNAQEEGDSYDPGTMTFFELALPPSSVWIGRKIGDVQLKADYGAVVVAIQRSGRHIRERASQLTLQSGDVLLVFGDDRSRAYLRQTHDFHVIEGVHEALRRTEKAPFAISIILAVVVLFIANVHHSIAALLGALLMPLTGCLSVRQTHQSVRWSIILFIAGMLALSKAMMETGTTHLLAEVFTGILPGADANGAWWLLVGLVVMTVVLTEFLTNNAVAVLMTPLAIELAHAQHLPAAPYVMGVALGASSSFANPMGYQTNLMVLGPGGYSFRNFVRVGLPLDLLLIGTAIVVVPWLWPLE